MKRSRTKKRVRTGEGGYREGERRQRMKDRVREKLSGEARDGEKDNGMYEKRKTQ